MQIDLDNVSAQTFSSTVCIVGGGIAGLAIATRLARHGIDVHILEAGGLDLEERSQALYTTEQPAETHRGAHEGRFRTFGGSSVRWGGQLLTFPGDIFSPPPGSPSRPWPIAEAELSPFYQEIQRIFGTDLLPFDADLLTCLGHPSVAFSSEITVRFSKWAPFPKRNLANTLGKDALAHPKITVFTHANTASLERRADTDAAGNTTGNDADAGGDSKDNAAGNIREDTRHNSTRVPSTAQASQAEPAIQSATVVNYAGTRFRFNAHIFIVAAGTIESSRLLLSSPDVPNPHDQLGRYFHDHLSFHAGQFTSPAREAMLEKLGPFFVSGTLHTCKLEASAQTRARDGLYAVMAHVVVVEPEDSGTAAIRNLLRSLQSGRIRQALAVNFLPMLRGAADVARLLFQARFRQRRAVSRKAQVMLNIDVEQSADSNNRIRLSDRRDALGLPLAIVDWRVNPAEQNTVLRFASIIRSELTTLGIAPSTWHASIEQQTPPALADTYHAMGGLCMGLDSTSSVVDPRLRVHGLSNLYIASCAVFPSGASSNPTFTMLALALRLADDVSAHLAEHPATHLVQPPHQ